MSAATDGRCDFCGAPLPAQTGRGRPRRADTDACARALRAVAAVVRHTERLVGVEESDLRLDSAYHGRLRYRVERMTEAMTLAAVPPHSVK